MDKIDLEEIAIFISDSIPKNKRFSCLSNTELCDLWKGICKYLSDQLSMKKSINLHGIGSFFTRNAKKFPGDTGMLWSLHFSPSKSWDKLPGFQIDRTVVVGTGAAESLNLAAVAINVGSTRESVEAGVKDIVNGLTRVLRRGSNISLSMGSLGKLNFQNNDVTFRFISSFIKALNDNSLKPKRPTEPLVPLEKKAIKEDEPKNIAVKEQKKEQNTDQDCQTIPVERNALILTVSENENKPSNIGNKVTLAPISEKSSLTEHETKVLTFDLDEASKKLHNLEDLIEKTFSKDSNSDAVHTHFYSGNRLWKNRTCPICKTDTMKHVVDLNAIKRAEKENDKMLLHISLEIDKEYLDNKKDREIQQHQNSIEAAQYNYRVSAESQQKVKEKLPMGDLFEKRKIQPPIMSPSQMAIGIHDQILAKREKNERSAKAHAMEDRLVCEKLKKEIKAAEIQAHLIKTKKSQQMHASLAEQIRLNRSLKEKEISGHSENPFARSESLLALYQREKAKQLYYEQLAIVRQKRDYVIRIADIDKKHSLNRLDIARKELQKDFKTIKKENFEVRRSLESYWSNQLIWKERLKKAQELVDLK